MQSQQQGTYYTQPLYAPPPHVIHHTTVVQPNGMPATMYAPPMPQPRPNGGITMGMVAGTTMAMSAGEPTCRRVNELLLPGHVGHGCLDTKLYLSFDFFTFICNLRSLS